MNQKKMNVNRATVFIADVKKAIEDLAEEYDIELAEGSVDRRLPAVLIHVDEIDYGGNFACVELRVYWEDGEND
jgi:hypothetical protein